MKYIKLFEDFIAEDAIKAEDSKVKIEDVSYDGGTKTIKAAEILGAIEASETEKEFKDYFFDQYGLTSFTTEEMSKLVDFYNQYQEEKNKEEADKEKEKEGGEEGAVEDPLAGIDTSLPGEEEETA